MPSPVPGPPSYPGSPGRACPPPGESVCGPIGNFDSSKNLPVPRAGCDPGVGHGLSSSAFPGNRRRGNLPPALLLMFPWMSKKTRCKNGLQIQRVEISHPEEFSANVCVQGCGEWISKDQEEDACMSAFLYFLRNHGFVKRESVVSPGFLSLSKRGILSTYGP